MACEKLHAQGFCKTPSNRKIHGFSTRPCITIEGHTECNTLPYDNTAKLTGRVYEPCLVKRWLNGHATRTVCLQEDRVLNTRRLHRWKHRPCIYKKEPCLRRTCDQNDTRQGTRPCVPGVLCAKLHELVRVIMSLLAFPTATAWIEPKSLHPLMHCTKRWLLISW